jgi:hypothetical protein
MFAGVLFSGETKGGVENLLVEVDGYPLVLPLVSREEAEARVDTGKWRHPFHRANPTPPPATPEIELLLN